MTITAHSKLTELLQYLSVFTTRKQYGSNRELSVTCAAVSSDLHLRATTEGTRRGEIAGNKVRLAKQVGHYDDLLIPAI
jgi:hypothetical protein